MTTGSTHFQNKWKAKLLSNINYKNKCRKMQNSTQLCKCKLYTNVWTQKETQWMIPRGEGSKKEKGK